MTPAERERLARALGAGTQNERMATEAHVLRLFLAGDRTAQALLIGHLTLVIRGAIWRIPASQRVDVQQDVWRHLLERDSRALRMWDPQRPGAATLQGYVYRVAQNEALKWLRQGVRPPEVLVGEPSHADHPESALLGALRRAELPALVRRWFPRTEHAVLMFECVADGWEPIEIARQLSKPEGTVTAFLSRLRDHLQSHLSGEEAAGEPEKK